MRSDIGYADNPYVLRQTEVVPCEHRAKKIRMISDSSKRTLLHLCQAMSLETNHALKKLLALKILEISSVTGEMPTELYETLEIHHLGEYSNDIQEAIRWRLPY